ncbi:MAG: phosphoglucosamine mutase [Candidatus Omnitrophica bacterium]|nr:phosphoglucosamine mutase [Candidatus Omnitrophota bacterium]MCM8777022.1 phosphoglucosamine mutase [Candidatus Omnitrophota bacterium]
MNDKIKNGLQISVSGIRGIYPDFLTSEIVFNFGIVFGSYIRTKKVFVCSDTRTSGKSLKDSIITGLLCTGKDVVDLGIAPTPEMGCVIEKEEMTRAAGIVITASHNPQEYNGIKFFSEKGTFLNTEEMKRMLDVYYKRAFTISKEPGFLSFMEYTDKYFSNIYRTVDVERIRAKKFNVVVDVCQGVGAIFTEKFLKGLGCDVVLLNKEPPGIFAHNPEPLPENLVELSETVIKEKADIGFAQDPDCDRLAIVSEDGNIPGEEMVIVLATRDILEYHKKGGIVVNLSTTALIEEITRALCVSVHRTKIGEVNVVEKMKETGSVIGGEGNGGVIFPDVHYGRDSFVGMALILEYLAYREKCLSEIIDEMPKYFMIKKKISISDRQKVEEILKNIREKVSGSEKVNLEDGIKIIRTDGWVHIRPSGTEPVIRIYVEGKNKNVAERYLSEFISLLSG